MYNNFFGFKERPFQLVPNPGYLYLSRSHEEAIAHLRYALSHGDGFVEITGEVGTGKTTLCRAFLEDLDPDTEIAYIFNPRLNGLELLRAINQEFDIPSDADNTKDLIDRLNSFLMEKKSQGKSAILLIDEAQNLSKEVLEQIRLLSNLETNTSKLLQIILVGQPELQKLLDSYELRQLRQRITLSWYLTPLSRKETREYIRHRINIASKKTEDKFSESAYDVIYKYSRGIPRLINIACDRALLTAFGYGKDKVTQSIARDAVRELTARGNGTVPFFAALFTRARIIAGIAALSVIAIILLIIYLMGHTPDTLPAPAKPAATPVASSRSQPVTNKTLPAKAETKPPSFPDQVQRLSNRTSRQAAFEAVVSLWEPVPRLNPELENLEGDSAYFQLAAAQNNLRVLRVQDDPQLIWSLDLPAILEIALPGNFSPVYIALTGIREGQPILSLGADKQNYRLPPQQIETYWTGNGYILWRDFFNYIGNIPGDAPKESIITLKMLLREIGFKDINLDDTYDDATEAAVKQIQQKHHIEIDGIVGTRTRIVIYNEKKDLNIPRLRSNRP